MPLPCCMPAGAWPQECLRPVLLAYDEEGPMLPIKPYAWPAEGGEVLEGTCWEGKACWMPVYTPPTWVQPSPRAEALLWKDCLGGYAASDWPLGWEAMGG